MRCKIENKSSVVSFFLIIFSLSVAGCSGGGGGGGGGGSSATVTPTPTSAPAPSSSSTLYAISISPSSSTIKSGSSQQFTATGEYVDTTTYAYSTADITSSVTWSSSSPTVATINTYGGLAHGLANGTTTITASSGSISGTTKLSVTDWTTRLRAPSTDSSMTPLTGIAYNGTTYVSTQYAANVSKDLLVWDEVDSVADDSDIIWSGSKFLRGGFFGFSTSTDGISWVSPFYDTSTYVPTKIAYSNTLPLYVAVAGTEVYTSPDAASWTMSTLPGGASARSVTWTGTQFVVVGSGILTSSDGLTWTARTTGTSHYFDGVGSSSSLIVACTDGSYTTATDPNGIYTSTDGIAWTLSTTITSYNGCDSIAHNDADNLWMMGGFNFSASSTDGLTWTTNLNAPGDISSIIYDGKQFVAAGGTPGWDEPAIYISSDGVNWDLKDSFDTIKSVARSATSGRLVAVTYTDRSLVSDDDGLTWKYGGFSAGNTGEFFSNVTWSSSLNEFIASSGKGVLSSIDGLNWSQLGTTFCYGKIESSPNLLIGKCGSGAISSSTDGVTWTPLTYPSTQSVDDLFWTGTQWVALGYGGDIVTSPDGITWTLRSSGTTNSLYGFAASPSIMVAVGYNGTLLTSTDNGVSWAPQSISTTATLNRVIWTGSKFVLIDNYGEIHESVDGITWTGKVSPYSYSTSGTTSYSLEDIIQTGTSLVMVGTGGLVATSP